jgi:hypothetical protein
MSPLRRLPNPFANVAPRHICTSVTGVHGIAVAVAALCRNRLDAVGELLKAWLRLAKDHARGRRVSVEHHQRGENCGTARAQRIAIRLRASHPRRTTGPRRSLHAFIWNRRLRPGGRVAGGDRQSSEVTAIGPTLPTWVPQQVGGYPGYTSRDANIVLKAIQSPHRCGRSKCPVPTVRWSAVLRNGEGGAAASVIQPGSVLPL